MKCKKIISLLIIVSTVISTFSLSVVAAQNPNDILNSKYMILVNRENKLSSDYVPDDLVYFKNSGYKLEKTCADALEDLIDACKAAGGETLVLYSGYRSYQTQYNKYYGKINQYISNGYSEAKARELTDQYYAPPGGSEHHTGLAADICTPSIVNRYGQLHESFANTTEGKWLRNNSWKYGFILRYDKGKEKITGYNYEPWHFRYVGLEQAKKIYDSALTYEEYVANLKTVAQKVVAGPKLKVTDEKITFSSPAGTVIRYTTNNKIPTEDSKKYTSSLNAKNVTYKAAVFYKGYISPVTTVTVTSYGDVFTDFTVKDWYYKIVSETVHHNIFKGIGDYQFTPNDQMNRAMLVQVLANISGVDLTKYKGKTKYTDVNSKLWYAPAVQWATECEIVKGMGDDTFAPLSPVTREQACVIFHNHSKEKAPKKVSLSFADASDISSWAKKGVIYCHLNKIVSGYPDNTFKPQNSATRAEVAKIALTYKNLQAK